MSKRLTEILKGLNPEDRIIIQKELDKLKETKKALDESNEKYQTLLENAPEAIVIFDIEKGQFVDLNQKAIDLYKLPREELLKVGPADLSPEKQADGRLSSESAMEKILKALAGETPIFEWLHLDSAGNIFPCEIRLVRFPSLTRKLVRGSIITISDRLQAEQANKRIEEALRESEKKYRDLFEKSKDAILIIENGTFVDCNQATVEMLRYKKKKELLQTHPSELSPEKQPDGRDSVEKANEMMQKAIAKGSNRFEWDHIRADGEVFPVEVLLTTIYSEKGSQIIHTVWREISERRRTRELQSALLHISQAVNEEKTLRGMLKVVYLELNKLIDISNFYVALYDENSETYSFPFFIDKYEEMKEFQEKSLPKSLTDYVRRTGKPLYADVKTYKSLEKKGEVALVGNRSPIWLGVPLILSKKVLGVVAVQDYTNPLKYSREDLKLLNFVSENIASAISKKMIDETVRTSEKKLIKLNADKDRLFSIIAHDLRAPFNALLGYTEFLAAEVKELAKGEIENVAENIHNSAMSVFRLLENLLLWSRYQTGRLNYSPIEYYFHDQLEVVLGIFSISLIKKNITIESKIKSNQKVFADKDMIETVLRNFISNAIKFTNPGGKIGIKCADFEDKIEITIADNGVGMTKETVAHLFDMGNTITTLGTNKEKGTGLGLLLCKDFVDLNKGEIKVKSKRSKGSEFTFSLPKRNIKNNGKI